MQDLFELIVSLLGKSEHDPQVVLNLKALGEPSRTYEFPPSHKGFEYRDLGVGLTYDLKMMQFWLVGYELGGKRVASGEMKPFKGRLCYGITITDAREKVEQKFGVHPCYTAELQRGGLWRSKYELDSYLFDCLFESEHGALVGINVLSLALLRQMQNNSTTPS